MSRSWTAADERDGEYVLLCAAEGLEELHVFVEGPRPRHMTDWGQRPQPYQMRHLAVNDHDDMPLEFRGGSWASVGPPAGPTRELIHTAYRLRQPDTQLLSVTLVDEETDATLWSATLHQADENPPSTWHTQIISQGVDGIRMLGAACGRDMFYVMLEGPYRRNPRWTPDREPTGVDDGPALRMRYALTIDAERRHDIGYAGQDSIGKSRTATRETMTVCVQPHTPQTPSRVDLTLLDAATRQELATLAAHRRR